ncbi:MAG: hypothetical protein ACJAZS_000031 [Alteromonas naphthalenivorans]|jgi:hypothetical protein
MAKTASLVFVLYDGIEHSIFEGQVLDPLLKKLGRNKTLTATLVSFEKKYPSTQKINRLNKLHPRLSLKLFKKTIFLGWPSLALGAWQLKTFLTVLTHYSLIARGPLAGLITQRALTSHCMNLTLQARGLLAKEYAFSTTNSSFFTYWLHRLRTYQLAYWEQEAYTYKATVAFKIQIVSKALQDYLITTYTLPSKIFTYNQHDDTPIAIKPAQRTTLRSALRTKLKIPSNAYVYVYNGSAKPWQCPTQTIIFFKDQLKKKPNSFLLLLTTDLKIFKNICKQEKLCLSCYKIITVSHKNILSYLCVADEGILLREQNILNWVSRPTKYLEYKAAGLPVIHNNTIAFVQQEG